MYPENDWRNYLEHSLKGQKWARHKYLYITPSGRYIYPQDVSTVGGSNEKWDKWRVNNDARNKVMPIQEKKWKKWKTLKDARTRIMPAKKDEKWRKWKAMSDTKNKVMPTKGDYWYKWKVMNDTMNKVMPIEKKLQETRRRPNGSRRKRRAPSEERKVVLRNG